MRINPERLAAFPGKVFRQTVLLTGGDVTAENDERSDMMVRSDTTIDGVMQMLQTMTPLYVRYLHGEQPWPETVVLWPFGKERRQAARRAKAERIAREALNRPDIHALVLRQTQDVPTDAFQIAELLVRAITSHVLAKRVALPLDPYVFALLAEQIQQIGRSYFEQPVTQYDSQISPLRIRSNSASRKRKR